MGFVVRQHRVAKNIQKVILFVFCTLVIFNRTSQEELIVNGS